MLTLKGKTSDEVWPQLEEVVLTYFPTVRERLEAAVEPSPVRRSTILTEKVLEKSAKVAEQAVPINSPIKLSTNLP